MLPAAAAWPELEVDAGAPLPMEALLAAAEPVVLRGAVRDWGLVNAARSMPEAMAYLLSFYNGMPVTYSWGGPEVQGRPFYEDGFAALNCEVRRDGLGVVLDQLAAHASDTMPPSY